MGSKSGIIDGLPERALMADEAAGDKAAQFTMDDGPFETSLFLLEKARGALKSLKKGN